jgi:hypothetical protein
MHCPIPPQRRPDLQSRQHPPHSSSLEALRGGDTVRLILDNQKSGQRGATMHHTTLLVPFCPVKALADPVHHLFQIVPANPEPPISFVSLGSHVISNNITLAVREMLSCSVSSTPATACPELVPTHSKPVELWPYNSTMLMKTSSKKWVDGQAPGGSRIYTLKFLPSPQVCPNAWWCTMCFITLGRNPMSLYPSFYRFPWQGEGATQIHHRRAMLVCLLHQLRCTKLYNNIPVYQKRGATHVACPYLSNGPWFEERKKTRMGAGRHCQEGHQVGKFSNTRMEGGFRPLA